MKLARTFAILITAFLGLCIIETRYWTPWVNGWQPSWWQSDSLASVGAVFFYPIIVFIGCLDNLENRGYQLPNWLVSNWLVYTAFYSSLILELLGVGWVFYLGFKWMKFTPQK